jgi:hypothetical protein
MIYMETNLTLQPGKMSAYLEALKGMIPLIEKAGMKVIGSWNTVIGNTNEMSYIFACEDMGQLQKA